jgi:mannose-1-phosphate guanylyltransferase/mannose-6-phosphate isomerase
MSKNIHKIVPVILCGGSGTRLWPLSRAGFPKQFLTLTGTTSLFQQAIHRLNCLEGGDIAQGQILIVTGEEHRFIALDQLREMHGIKASILLEPSARNTAPALTFAALHAIKEGCDPILVVTPADQTVQDPQRFADALQRSIRVAAAGSIVILGITPDKPETGYGYIKRQGSIGAMGEYAVAQFAEKPDIETAKAYFEAGDFAWNGGIFVVRASIWLKALTEFRPDIMEATKKACVTQTIDMPFIRPEKNLFSSIPSESIDFAVIEKCPSSSIGIKMVPLDAGWNDLGSWDAVWQVGLPDLNGNVANGDTLLADTTNTYVHSSSRLVSAVGVNNLVVIETADAVLIADKSQSQHVKKIVSQLGARNRSEGNHHRKVHRPWGWYDNIDEGERFKVKRIQVKPGASLSLQKHQHRSEHWVVIKGVAEITNGDQTLTLTENQSTYIPPGVVHRLSNQGSVMLEIIEVQSGLYLEEDDIVRFEDSYGRVL